MLDLLPVRHVEGLDVRLVLSYVGDSVPFLTHPLVDIGPLSILGHPNFRENAAKLPPRIRLWASEFDLYVVLLRCDSL